MPIRKPLDHLDCAVANTVDLIGDRWTLLILRDAFLGVRRFDDFRRDLDIASNVLTARLEALVAAGVLLTRSYQEHPPRHEYLLTEKGKDLFDVLLALWRWGDRWEQPDTERRLIHRDCGADTHLAAACAHCGGPLTLRNVRIEPGLEVVLEHRARREQTVR